MRAALILLSMGVALAGCMPKDPREGAFGAVCVWPDSGEKVGNRITVRGIARPKVAVTICEGKCTDLSVSNAKITEDRIEFDTAKTAGGPALHFVGRFDEDTLIIEGRAATTSLGPLQLHKGNADCPAGTKPA